MKWNGILVKHNVPIGTIYEMFEKHMGNIEDYGIKYLLG